MTDLPDSWAICTIADVTLPVTMISNGAAQDKEIRYIDISSIDNQRNRVADPKQLKMADAPSRARQIVKAGDVLFATVRPYLRNIAQVPAHLDDEIASTGFAVLRSAIGIDPTYLFYKTISRDFVAALTGEQYGVSYPAVKEEQVRSQPFELPPLPEQRRIVAKIEALFSELDAGEESLTRARAQLSLYRQSLLKAAFQGKLTADWRAANPDKLEPPETLLARIRKERETRHARALTDWQTNLTEWRAGGEVGRKPAKPSRLPEATFTTDGIELPFGWAAFRVGSLCEVVRGGSPRPAGDPKYYGGNIPFLKVADLTRVSGMYVQTHTFTITEAGLSKTRMTKPGTLMISNSGATLGVPKICTFDATFNDGIAAFLGLSPKEQDFHYYFWESKTAELRGLDQGAAQPNLNTGILAETVISLCCLEEMAEVTARLSMCLSQIANMETEITTALARLKALRQSILKKAFSGQLVPQDPVDEPASALLARLRATPAAKPRRKKTA